MTRIWLNENGHWVETKPENNGPVGTLYYEKGEDNIIFRDRSSIKGMATLNSHDIRSGGYAIMNLDYAWDIVNPTST